MNKNIQGHANISLLPNFCEVRQLFMVIIFTEVLAIVFSLATTRETMFWNYLAVSSFVMLWIALLNAAMLCVVKEKLQQLTHKSCLIISFILMMIVSLLVTLLIHYFLTNIFYDAIMVSSLFVLRVLAISAVIYFFLLRYFYIQYQWRINLAAKSHAEILSLRARIRPHFLFNSLNTIASLISYDPNSSEAAIENLADLFRASLSEKTLCTLQQEIDLTKKYFAIESLRLGERLEVNWDIDPKLLNTQIPSLFIQPLAENAVYHGVEPLEKGGKIDICALQVEGKLLFSISNPLPLVKRKAQAGNKMALDNIKRRLTLVYGKKSKLDIIDTKEKYTVTFTIPLVVNG